MGSIAGLHFSEAQTLKSRFHGATSTRRANPDAFPTHGRHSSNGLHWSPFLDIDTLFDINYSFTVRYLLFQKRLGEMMAEMEPMEPTAREAR